MKLCYFPLLASLLASLLPSKVYGRVVLLYVDSAQGPRVSVALTGQASLLDQATDPVLWERPDPDPCAPGVKPAKGQFLLHSQSPQSRSVPIKPTSHIEAALAAAAATLGEAVTLYSLSWERRAELRGMTVVPFPTEGTLPGWVRQDYFRTIGAIGTQAVKTTQPAALLLYADLGGAGLGPDQWRAWGVNMPATASKTDAPFLTRQDFSYLPRMAELTLGASRGSRPHRVRFYVRSPWSGRASCAAAKAYPKFQKERMEQDSKLLSALTGWTLSSVLSKSGIFPPKSQVASPPWP